MKPTHVAQRHSPPPIPLLPWDFFDLNPRSCHLVVRYGWKAKRSLVILVRVQVVEHFKIKESDRFHRLTSSGDKMANQNVGNEIPLLEQV